MKNFYAKFLAILCTFMMMASSAFAQKAIEFIANSSGSIIHEGVSVTAKYPTENQGFNVFGDMDSEWGWLKVGSIAGNILKIEFEGTADINLLTCSEGSFTSGTSTKATWEGESTNITFHSTGDAYVTKLTVYVEEGEIVKECSVDYDHLGVKPGKTTNIPQYITVYFSEAPAYTLTSDADIPEEARIESEYGNVAVEDIKFWATTDNDGFYQFSIITEHSIEGTDETIGNYTLVIPEGLIPFANGKWNKEIRIDWTLVKPDLRAKIPVTFDLAKEEFDKTSAIVYVEREYGAEEPKETPLGEVTLETASAFNSTANALRIQDKETITFTAPEGLSIVKVELANQEIEGLDTFNSAFNKMTATEEGECSYTDKTFTWEGDAQSVTLTSGAKSTYARSATITIAYEVPEPDPEGPTAIMSVGQAESNNAIYDLQGRRVVKAQSGLYIKNGVKVIY